MPVRGLLYSPLPHAYPVSHEGGEAWLSGQPVLSWWVASSSPVASDRRRRTEHGSAHSPRDGTGSGEPKCTSARTSSQCAVRTPLLRQVPRLTFPSGHPTGPLQGAREPGMPELAPTLQESSSKDKSFKAGLLSEGSSNPPKL